MKSIFLGLSFLCLAPSLVAQATAPPSVTCATPSAAKTDADRAFAQQKFADAETLYSAQAATKPDDAAWAGLVHSQIELNKVPEALATANKAAAALPKSGNALALVGDAELRAGHLDEAADAYKRARTLDPCSAAAHFGNARLLQLSSQHASALKELAYAHRLAPTDAAISEALFSTLPPSMQSKGLRNLLASDKDLSPARRSRLEQRAALMEAGATCKPTDGPGAASTGIVKLDLTPLYFDGASLRDYALHATTGGSSINLELDSTASGIVLSESDARKLKVTAAVAGSNTVPYLGFVDSLQFGKQHYDKCAVSVVSDATLARRYSVIGTDFFRDSLIHIDWNAKQITLTPYAEAAPANGAPLDAVIPAAEKEWAKVYLDHQRILTPAAVEKKPVGLLMLDTSSILNMLAPSAAAQFHPLEDQTIGISGVSGELVRTFEKEGTNDVNRSELRDVNGKNLPVRRAGSSLSVRFAGNAPPQFGLWTYDITPASAAAGVEIAGIVGYTVLQQYYLDLDYRNGLVNLKYDLNFPFRKSVTEQH